MLSCLLLHLQVKTGSEGAKLAFSVALNSKRVWLLLCSSLHTCLCRLKKKKKFQFVADTNLGHYAIRMIKVCSFCCEESFYKNLMSEK